jgi:small conductance mechanosensitive channel
MKFVASTNGAHSTFACFCTVFILSILIWTDVSNAQQDKTKKATFVESIAVDAIIDKNINEKGKDVQSGLSAEVIDSAIDPSELDFRLIPLTIEDLATLADKWLDIVKSKTEEVMAAQIAIYKTDGNIEEAARDKLTELTNERRHLFSKYEKVVSAWEKKGGDPKMVAKYRAYQSAIVLEETRQADYKTLLAQAQAWLIDRDGGVEVAIDVLVIVVALLSLLFFARIIRRLARRWMGNIPNLSVLLQVFLVTVIYWLVITFGLMLVLSALGIDITPAFALIGGASFILAFAFQDTLGNLASGLMILINRPFDQGDYVDVAGVAGTVKAVTIFSTTVVTPDNRVIVIPNKNVWSSAIVNVTASNTRRVDLVFGISYDDSIPEAIRVMGEVIKDHPLVHDDPEPMIRVHELANSSVNFICRPWTRTDDYWTVYWDITQQVKERFDAAGLSIPYPQQDVHIRNLTAANTLEKMAPGSE